MTNEERSDLLDIILDYIYIRPRKHSFGLNKFEIDDFFKVAKMLNYDVKPLPKIFVLKEKTSGYAIGQLIKEYPIVSYKLSACNKLLFREEDLKLIKNLSDFEVVEVPFKRHIKRKLTGNPKKLTKFIYERN